ncbi:MAG TPA: (d)CMP kinase [Alphaproteobacteria bacterium]|nr:(d)CMP kinase [Alphaproteobacteria bacterium]
MTVIAIDGPAASGKGTLARRIAEKLGFAWLDTGLLYRAAGMVAVDLGADPGKERAAAQAATQLTERIAADGPGLLQDPRLRTDEAAAAASKLSAVAAARAALLDFQRTFARNPPNGAPGAVLDGRDIGTVICPDADVKLFVTATVEERARRRVKELQGRGQAAIYTAVLEDLKQRDARDSQRAVAPLKQAADAVLLDTSALDADQALAAALAMIDRILSRSAPSRAGRQP